MWRYIVLIHALVFLWLTAHIVGALVPKAVPLDLPADWNGPADVATMIAIPDGEHRFIVRDGRRRFAKPRPSEIVETLAVAGFEMRKYPVTFGEYVEFVHETSMPIEDAFLYVPDWMTIDAETGRIELPTGKENLAARYVTWTGATAYCHWLTARDPAFIYRLPTALEWEYVASNGGKNRYPWGDHFRLPGTHRDFAVVDGIDVGKLPVGTLPENESDHGVADLIGNVPHWTSDLYEQGSAEGKSRSADPPQRVIKGGSFVPTANFWFGDNAPASGFSVQSGPEARRQGEPYRWGVGFRCVRIPVDVPK